MGYLASRLRFGSSLLEEVEIEREASTASIEDATWKRRRRYAYLIPIFSMDRFQLFLFLLLLVLNRFYLSIQAYG